MYNETTFIQEREVVLVDAGIACRSPASQ